MAKLKSNLGVILKERGISAAQLSTAISHRRSTINDLINKEDLDNNRITGSLIANICSYLKITPNDLFEVEETDDYYRAAFLALKNKLSMANMEVYFGILSKNEKGSIYTNLTLYQDGHIGFSLESQSDEDGEEDEDNDNITYDDPHLILIETHPNDTQRSDIEEMKLEVIKKLRAMSLNYTDTNVYRDNIFICSSENLGYWVNKQIAKIEDKSTIRILKWEHDFNLEEQKVIDWYADNTTLTDNNLYLKKALGSFRDFDGTFFESMNIFICFPITEENLHVLRSMKKLYNFVYHIFMNEKDAHNLMGSVDITDYLKDYIALNLEE
ncbi:helix-turn-helix domain-containing protein [Brevibacillus sp. NRS-1366]|uniref:helix-turn-helix domain-containing protein n=1 Tax=Brevibacillus sp. NRS-1366 TaxID=3233899 RepID=UPI003D1D63CA